MYGKPRTLLTWFGKSERPVATIASGRAAIASGYEISGSGFASAKMIGRSAIVFSISGVTVFGDREAHEHVGAAHRVGERAAAVVGDRELLPSAG